MEASGQNSEPKKVSGWLVRMLQGVLVGSGAILPGVSGGVLCVSFGLYKPIMELLAHPLRNYKKQLPLLLPVALGGLLGFFAFAKLILLFFNADSNLGISLFFGLIVGTFPSLYRQAGKKGRGGWDWLAFTATFLILGASFWLMRTGASFTVRPGILSYTLCGILWGLSVVVPGMTSSSVLIFLGLFEPMTAGVVAMDPLVLLPMALGVGGSLVLASRLVSRMFRRHYARMFHVVLGFVAASTLAIVPHNFGSLWEFLACAALAAAGFAGTIWMNKLFPGGDEEK